MDTGTTISGLGHVAVLLVAAIGGPFFDSDDDPKMQVSDVSLITETEFAALAMQEPARVEEVETPALPSITDDVTQTPSIDTTPDVAAADVPDDPQAAGDAPDLSAVVALPDTEAATDSPELADQPTDDPAGASVILPDAVTATADNEGRQDPDQLAMVVPTETPQVRVDTEAAPTPSPDAEQSDEVESATERSPDATSDAQDDQTEQAPDAAATEIVTEAEQTETNLAPVRTSRPKGRPVNLATDTATSDAIDAAVAAAQVEATPSDSSNASPSGPALSDAEKEGLRLAVRKCWNLGSLSSEAQRVTVTIAVSLARDGKPQGGVTMIGATEGSADAQNKAFEAARRAVLRCGAKGFDLPVAKYDHWRNVEITFNPEKMRIK